MCRYSDRWYPDPSANCCGSAGGAGGHHRGYSEVLPHEAVEETSHEEGREDGDEEQRRQGLLWNNQ